MLPLRGGWALTGGLAARTRTEHGPRQRRYPGEEGGVHLRALAWSGALSG